MNLVEQLMRIDRETVSKRATKKIKSKRLSKLLGVNSEITIQELGGKRINDLNQTVINKRGEKDYSKMYDLNLMYCVDGVVEPSLKNEELMTHFGAATPKDLAALLFDTECGKIADEIAALSGVTDDAEEEVKN